MSECITNDSFTNQLDHIVHDFVKDLFEIQTNFLTVHCATLFI